MMQAQKLTKKLTPSVETVCIAIAAAFILCDTINFGSQCNAKFLRLVYLVDMCASVGMIVASCTGKSKLYLPFIILNAVYICIYSGTVISFTVVKLFFKDELRAEFSKYLCRFTAIAWSGLLPDDSLGAVLPFSILVTALALVACEMVFFRAYKRAKDEENTLPIFMKAYDPQFSSINQEPRPTTMYPHFLTSTISEFLGPVNFD